MLLSGAVTGVSRYDELCPRCSSAAHVSKLN
jgi:hypothetical protein